MNENEIPNHDFDQVLAFFEAIIGKHRKNPTQPKNGCLCRIKLLTSIIDQLEQIRSDAEKELSNVKSDCPIILPVHHGYTVDFMLRQFRKAIPGKVLEFISFDSVKGEALLCSLEEERPDIIE